MKTLRDMRDVGVAAHIGAGYYLRDTGKGPLRVDQNSDQIRNMVMCAGAFLHIVAPEYMLASSPTFADSLEEAMVSAVDWVVKSRMYKKGWTRWRLGAWLSYLLNLQAH